MCLIIIINPQPPHKQTRAMQSQAVLGDKRPNCIILDEVRRAVSFLFVLLLYK